MAMRPASATISATWAASGSNCSANWCPGAAVAYLLNPKNQNAEAHSAEVKQAANALSQPIEVLIASSQGEIEAAFQIMVRQKATALLIGDDPFFSTQSDLIIGLAARHALPTMHYRTDYVAAGGLISYGSSQGETYRQAGLYTGRILKGEKPSDLPVVQPTKFELATTSKQPRRWASPCR